MKRLFVMFAVICACAVIDNAYAQNLINQTVVISGDSDNNKAGADGDIGGVEFRRIRTEPGSSHYYEFENYHSFPVTVHWQATISSDRFSHWYSYGDRKTGTIVIPANSKKRMNETYVYAYDMDFIKVKKL